MLPVFSGIIPCAGYNATLFIRLYGQRSQQPSSRRHYMTRFNCIVPALLLLSTLGGCANPRQVMVNPNNWEQTVCSASGWGLQGAPEAVSLTNTCVDKQKALGLIPLEEVEAQDTRKFDTKLDAAGMQALRPEWEAGDYWEYATSNEQEVRVTVDSRDYYRETDGYVISINDNDYFYNTSLGLMAAYIDGTVDTDYEPALVPYDFPLHTGKKWDYSGIMRRKSGTTAMSMHHEVKGYGTVKVPAGEFAAYYILSTSDYGSRIIELWYSPSVKSYVKAVIYTDSGTITEELTGYNTD